MITLSREDVLDLVSELDDPEELCADLIDAIQMATHTGDFMELEEVMDSLEAFFDIMKSESSTSWRSFWQAEL